jgi:hypothetical protein
LFTEYLPVLTLHRRTLEALTSTFFANDLAFLLLPREIRPGLLETLLANLWSLTPL